VLAHRLDMCLCLCVGGLPRWCRKSVGSDTRNEGEKQAQLLHLSSFFSGSWSCLSLSIGCKWWWGDVTPARSHIGQPQRDIGHRASAIGHPGQKGSSHVWIMDIATRLQTFAEGATLSKTFFYTAPSPSISRGSA
jgi:hypothetical protein